MPSDTSSALPVVLLLGVVTGDGFSQAYHVVVPDNEAGRNVLKRKIATEWCATYWEALHHAPAFEMFQDSDTLNEAFDYYFNNHDKESCDLSVITTDEITAEDLGALVGTKRAKTQSIVEVFAAADFMPEARAVDRDPLLGAWLVSTRESAISLSKQLEERAQEDMAFYKAEQDAHRAKLEEAAKRAVEQCKQQAANTTSQLAALVVELVRGFQNSAPVDWCGRDLPSIRARVEALWDFASKLETAEATDPPSGVVALAQLMLSTNQARAELKRLITGALDGGLHQARPQLQAWLQAFKKAEPGAKAN